MNMFFMEYFNKCNELVNRVIATIFGSINNLYNCSFCLKKTYVFLTFCPGISDNLTPGFMNYIAVTVWF